MSVPMRKVSLIVLSVILTVSLLAACRDSKSGNNSSSSASRKVLRVAHAASEAYHMHRALLFFKDELEKTAAWKVEIYPNGQIGNDTELIEQAKAGDIDINVTPTSYYTDEAPTCAFIEMPYVFKSREIALKVLAGPWGKEQGVKLEQAGLHSLGYMENGMRHLTNNVREITVPGQVAGLKFRTMPAPVHVFFWNSLGASAEGSPFPELYTNLSTKVFDGEENPVAHIYSSKFYEVQSYMSITGHAYTSYFGSMNMDYWNKCTPEQQRQLIDAWAKAYEYQIGLINKEEQEQLKEIENNKTFPTKVTVLTSDQIQAFMDAAKSTHEKFKVDVGVAEWDKFIQAIQDAEKL